ncbi:LysR substrate-binding domain-containing protein [Thiomicrorhabdus sp. zzn3]|uniref:LysR substrate-binding domain-containing protein n=1 Tax=Thiomicrorhabdus sp. zzn3 TaxID=3039775 RepID=UPI002436B920|nr:LysR substrate-binding domain-containing protein [Thiomicrorhabdus sp. zzn3]MDG6778377.1 LysR substrate-binding domain-containing protein [Thiomicrorhabdus sp. zzn3]
MPEKISLLARNATLRQLQVFESIARNQSFTKAAEELHLTQPTVSMQVKKLSDVLDAPLFEQIGRKVYLTAAGQALYEAAEAILAKLSIAEQKINHLKGFSGGTVKLSVISTAQYFVPKVIQEFTQAYPNVTVLMRVGNKETLLDRITQNKDDFYLLGQPPEGLNVSSSPLAINPLAFVANPNHPLVGKSLSIKDLEHEPFLMRETGSGIRAQVEKVFQSFDFKPSVKMVLGSNEAIRLGLMQNLGITVASIPTLLNEIERGEIAILKVKGFPINRHWYLAYPNGKVLSIAAEKLIELLKREGESLSEQAFNKLS